jgi:hypothetical protein
MKEMEKDVKFYFSIIKSKLFKKIRKSYNFTHKDIALLIFRSENSVKQYEKEELVLPLSILSLLILKVKISKKEIEDLLLEIDEEIDTFEIEAKGKAFEYVRDFVEKTLENVFDEIDGESEYKPLDIIRLKEQIKAYIKKYETNNKNIIRKIDETVLTKEIISFLNFKINNFVEENESSKIIEKEIFEEILEEV